MTNVGTNWRKWVFKAVVGVSAGTMGCSSASTDTAVGENSIGRSRHAIVSAPKKVAYWPAWTSDSTPEPAANLPWDKITHINVSFLGITPKTTPWGNKYQCRFWTDYLRQDIEDTAARTNTQNLISYRNSLPTGHAGKNVKILLALGGWTLSYRFSDALSTDANRNDLADSCISEINALGADGLDIDWEYPTRLGPTSGDGACHEGTCQRSTDAANLTAFLDKLRSKTAFNGKLLTLALRANRAGDSQNIPYEYQNFFTGTPTRLDFVNMMTYDFHGTWESVTNYTGPFDKMTQAMEYAVVGPNGVDDTTDGVGSAKKDRLVLGIPFYGPMWNSASDAVGASASGHSIVTYRDAVANYLGKSTCNVYGTTQNRRLWCSGTVNGVSQPWISFDDATVVGTKAEWVATNNYGGAMWWAQGGDTNDGALVAAIDAKLPTGSSSCTPTTCSAASAQCGSISDGCGGTLNCGTCSTGYTCNSANQCVSTQTPYGGTARAVPGKIQAEDFDNGGPNVAYYDTTTSNRGNSYRTSEQVDIQATTDTGGGYNVGWAIAGEWLEYTVNVGSAGTYNLDLRVAATSNGRVVRVLVDDIDVTGALTVPNTGGSQTFQTITKTGISLSAGNHIVRFKFDSGAVNLNWLEFRSAASCTPTTCSAAGAQCGSINNGCGGTLSCGSCSSGYSCNSSNQCIATSCSSSNSVATIGHGQYYDVVDSACITVAVNHWAQVNVQLQKDWSANSMSYAWSSCTGSGSGTLTSAGQSVSMYNGADPNCNFYVQLTGTGRVTAWN